MATESSSQKRKRGRPPNASKPSAAANASQNDTTTAPAGYDADAEEESRPRKRGRPRRSSDQPATENSVPSGKERSSTRHETTTNAKTVTTETRSQPKARKGQEVQDDSAVDKEDGNRATNGNPRRKRGRPSLNPPETQQQQEEQEPPQQLNTSQPALRRKRGRPAAESQNQNDEQQQDKPDQEQPEQPEQPEQRKKRGRPASTTENGEQQAVPGTARGRPSLRDLPPSTAQNAGSKAKKTAEPREKGASGKPTGKEEGAKSKAPKEDKTSRGRRPKATQSTDQANDEPVAAPKTNTNPEKPRAESGGRRRRSSQAEETETPPPPPSPSRPYLHVAPRVQRVSQSVIEAKWSPLSGAALAAATTILQLAHRPILQRLSSTQQRRSQALAALTLVASRIARKMRKGLPFPPATMTGVTRRRRTSNRKARGVARHDNQDSDDENDDGGREAELDFERVLDARQALERRLDPGLHAVDLLRREKERMERELERDYEALRRLETAARGQAREQRGLLKKAHVLAPAASSLDSQQRRRELGTELDIQRGGDGVRGNLFNDGIDVGEDSLRPLALQLSGHMDSIRTNLQQAEGIVPQIAESRAVLQDVLLRHLQPEQYEQIVLG